MVGRGHIGLGGSGRDSWKPAFAQALKARRIWQEEGTGEGSNSEEARGLRYI